MPAPSSDPNAIARFTGRNGENVGNSLVRINDSGALILPEIPNYAGGSGHVWYDGETVNFQSRDTGVTMNIGQEFYAKVRNVSGSSIPNGSAVYISGASAGLPTIALANANAAATMPAIGLTTQAIANNANGYVTVAGVVHGLNTNGLVAGKIYLGTTNGALTQSAPVAPDDVQLIGYVTVVSATIGEILVLPSQYILVQ